MCLPFYCWRHDTGTSHWQNTGESIDVDLNAGTIDMLALTRQGGHSAGGHSAGVGVAFNDTNAIKLQVINALLVQVQTRVKNRAGEMIEDALKSRYPNATIEPLLDSRGEQFNAT